MRKYTLHENAEDISEDGNGGAQDKHGEEESANGISYFVFWLR